MKKGGGGQTIIFFTIVMKKGGQDIFSYANIHVAIFQHNFFLLVHISVYGKLEGFRPQNPVFV